MGRGRWVGDLDGCFWVIAVIERAREGVRNVGRSRLSRGAAGAASAAWIRSKVQGIPRICELAEMMLRVLACEFL